VVDLKTLYAKPNESVDNFVDILSPPKALKIKALAGLPGKKADFKILMNQQLTSAMGLIALIHQIVVSKVAPSLFLCISASRCFKFRSKKW
jgi:hypothetical protein